MTLPTTHPTIAELNARRDRAYADALELRAQAMRDFWRGADHLLQSAALHAERAARRLAARLERRSAAPACTHAGVELP